MIHYLTIGFLKKRAVGKRELVPLKPLPEKIFSLVQDFIDSTTSEPRFENEPLVITEHFIKCPWYSPRRNRTSERFALAAREKFGCVLADIEHGRLVDEQEFTEE